MDFRTFTIRFHISDDVFDLPGISSRRSCISGGGYIALESQNRSKPVVTTVENTVEQTIYINGLSVGCFRLSLKHMWALALCLNLIFCLPRVKSFEVSSHFTTKEFTYEILSTWSCKSEKMSAENCPTQSGEFEIINMCGFKCKEGRKPICIHVETGTCYICSEADLACPPGIRRRAMLDKNDPEKLLVVEEECPNDYYQPTESSCYDACLYKRGDTEDIPDSFSILPGNTTSHALLYCDYINGYFNAKGKTFLHIEDWRFERDFCTHTSEKNPCNGTSMFPLPNGTCVLPCEKDFDRDVRKNFTCIAASNNKGITSPYTLSASYPRPINMVTTSPSSQSASTPETTNMVTTSLNSRRTSTSKYTNFTDPVIVADADYGKETDSFPIVIRTVLICVLGTACAVLIVVVVYKKRCREKGNRESQREPAIEMQAEVGTRDITTPLLDNNVPTAQLPEVLVDQCAEHSGIPNDDKHSQNRTEVDDRQFLNGDAGKFKNSEDVTIDQLFAGVLSKLMQSVGVIIHNGCPIGTVFRVGTVYVMTAFHVVENIISDPKRNMAVDPKRLELDENLFIHFEASVCTHSHSIEYKAKLTLWDQSTDMAILEIINPSNLPEPLLLWQHQFNNLHQTHLLAIGFGHPSERYKKHSEKCKIIWDDPNRHTKMIDNLKKKKDIYKASLNMSDASLLDQSYDDYFNANIIKLDLYMGKGLSGGPVITLDPKSPKVVGIILGGKPEFFYKLPLALQDEFPSFCCFEVAVKMEKLYEIIKTDRELTRNIFTE